MARVRKLIMVAAFSRMKDDIGKTGFRRSKNRSIEASYVDVVEKVIIIFV